MHEQEHIHIHVNFNGMEDRLDRIHHALRHILEAIQTTGADTMADLTRLTAEVTETSTAVDSAVVLLEQLAELIRQNSTDPAALDALADQLDSEGNRLAAAVVANTPAE